MLRKQKLMKKMNNHPAFLIHTFLFLIEVNIEVLEWSFSHVIVHVCACVCVCVCVYGCVFLIS